MQENWPVSINHEEKQRRNMNESQLFILMLGSVVNGKNEGGVCPANLWSAADHLCADPPTDPGCPFTTHNFDN